MTRSKFELGTIVAKKRILGRKVEKIDITNNVHTNNYHSAEKQKAK
jgi:hypothetical protein